MTRAEFEATPPATLERLRQRFLEDAVRIRHLREFGPPIPYSDPLAVPLEHDYGDDATLLANFLTVPHPTLRQQAAITLLCMAVRASRSLPVVDEDAVDVCAAAILDVTRAEYFRPSICATLAHLACRAFARHQVAEPTGAVDQHALLAIGEACAEVIEGA